MLNLWHLPHSFFLFLTREGGGMLLPSSRPSLTLTVTALFFLLWRPWSESEIRFSISVSPRFAQYKFGAPNQRETISGKGKPPPAWSACAFRESVPQYRLSLQIQLDELNTPICVIYCPFWNRSTGSAWKSDFCPLEVPFSPLSGPWAICSYFSHKVLKKLSLMALSVSLYVKGSRNEKST